MKHPNSVRSATLRMYIRGVPVWKIAQICDVGTDSVRRWARAAKLDRKNGGPRLFSEHTRAAAMKRFAKGDSARKIADDLGCALATVYFWAESMNVKRNAKPVIGTPMSKRQRAVAQYASGMTSTAVAEIHGVSRSRVADWARAAGMLRTPTSVPRVDHQRAHDLYAELGTLRATAERMGVSVGGVRRALERHRKLLATDNQERTP